MQRLSALDNSFLEIETDSIQANIGGVSVFEGPVPSQAALRRLVESKLDRVPRYRQRVRRLPLRIGMPIWVDDEHFNLGYHLRRTALPAPGGHAELDALVGRVMSQHLDRGRPLWEMWVVEGLEKGRWGLLWKVHHAMVDGVSANDLMSEVLDAEPVAPPTRPARRWRAQPLSRAELVTESVRGALTPLQQAGHAWGRLRGAPADLALRGAAMVRTVLPIAPSLAQQRVHTSLNGAIGPHRVWVRASIELDDVKRVRRVSGGSVNDVVLALVTRGLRDLLRTRGEVLDERTVRTMVPVSVRSQAERGTLANRVSAVFAELPVGVDNARERYVLIHEQMDGVKQSRDAVAGDVLVRLAGFAPPMLLALGARLALRTPQRMINTVATNVPGPQHPLYCAGRRMVEAWPYVMLAGRVRITTAIFSYDGTLYFGITGDLDTAPDIGVLARGITAGIDELLGTAEVAPRRYRTRSSSTTRTASTSAGRTSASSGSVRSRSASGASRSPSPGSGASSSAS